VPTTPRSYDEIVRRTVLDPDGAYRPSPEQVRRAYRGALTSYEEGMFELVHDALLEAGVDNSQLQIVVEHDWVVLRGAVRNAREAAHIADVVERIPGIRGITDLIVVIAPG
jgi:hypothetical protein